MSYKASEFQAAFVSKNEYSRSPVELELWKSLGKNLIGKIFSLTQGLVSFTRPFAFANAISITFHRIDISVMKLHSILRMKTPSKGFAFESYGNRAADFRHIALSEIHRK